MKSLVRLGIALLLILLGLVSYCNNTDKNPITGEKQQVQLSPQQEITLGLQARQLMTIQYGGFYPDKLLQQYIDQVGKQVVARSIASKSPYPFEFHLLSDARTVNAFALPGGQVFLTIALLKRLTSEAQLAAILSHEVGHVVARHGAEHLTKQAFIQPLLTAVNATATTDVTTDQATVIAQAVNQLVSLRYERNDELESDRLGLRFMTEAGYDPQGIVQLMQRLDAFRRDGKPPAFFSTHPSPDNRVKRLQTLITQTYPQGIPRNLKDNREAFAEIVQTRF
ncbi:M48 family metallopeptidase [Stenomitos frigidus]|uniref:Peptidase M48 Ste24p n=1 Tax=Stenomitos frigidus ULC18 TaxID=2107698 RepID=A0A2T1E893_9CYAN|nr:M48 family metallopeptidase [Stenomitos frigidus]PSB28956.1 peptidase M48 Ste24p [Stenomitos frigidus ULC18]